MKSNIKNTITSNIISAIIAIETLIPLILSGLIAYLEKSILLGFLLFLPISAVILSVFEYAYSKSAKLLPFSSTLKSLSAISVPKIKCSPSIFFKSLHANARHYTFDLLCIICHKNSNTKSRSELYRNIAEFRAFLIQTSIFRMFPAALIFDDADRRIMIFTAISATLIPPLIQNHDKALALCAFITLPQRSTVIFDGILRALGKFFLSKTFLYRFITKSQYAYLHSDRFVGISTYFWAFFLSAMLIFSKNRVLALSGLAFMISPLYMIYAIKKRTF